MSSSLNFRVVGIINVSTLAMAVFDGPVAGFALSEVARRGLFTNF